MDITELDKIARECVGKDRSEKEIDDWCKSLWGLPTSPTIGMKRQKRVDDILERLVDVEGGLGDARRGESELKRRKLDFRRKEDGLSVRVEGETSSLMIMSRGAQILDTALREDHTVEEASPDRILATSISCFINSRSNHQRCEACSKWKKAISKERRVHSLEALLVACKVQNGEEIKRGIVFVDVKDAIGIERTIDIVRHNAKEVRNRVLVFGCNVDRLSLKEENALLVV